MRSIQKALTCLTFTLIVGCATKDDAKFSIPAEFDEQEYIWLSWSEKRFFGSDPFYFTIKGAVKEITPFVKVKLFWTNQDEYNKSLTEATIYSQLISSGIDTSRVELFYTDRGFEAMQDPGPIFLKNENADFALTNFRFKHFDKKVESIDKNIAERMGIPTIDSEMISEGGAWQTNGKGTMLLVESVELDRNPKMTKEEIENEYKRVLGVKKIIWLKKGLKEEEWTKFDNGLYGIGTGGHIDEFCRFADERTILLAEVITNERDMDEISSESYRRMEENFEILKRATDQDGKPFNIVRVPTATTMTKKVFYNGLGKEEKSWFDNVTKDTVEFYLTTGYLNLIIANEVVVTSKYWKEGLPEEIRTKDEEAKRILEAAFPGRKIAQIDCMPVHHDGAGLHCHSRNEPRK
jgi:agmatine deiminase